jgi:NAD(P)-dependent dehydrogenase (short-subunit alcohol dehydrogenase family)
VACADEALGQAIAAALHKQGAAVLSLTNAPGADKPGLQTLSGDPARPEAVRAALEAAVRQYGGLDLLIAQDARPLAQGQAFLRLGLDPAAILIGGEALPALDAGVRGGADRAGRRPRRAGRGGHRRPRGGEYLPPGKDGDHRVGAGL